MSDFVVSVSDELVHSLGKQSVERYLQSLVAKALLSLAAQDVLQDYDSYSLDNDPAWHQAWRNSFEQDRYSGLIKVSAHV